MYGTKPADKGLPHCIRAYSRMVIHKYHAVMYEKIIIFILKFFCIDSIKQCLSIRKGKNMELKKRVKSFLEDTGATIMAFCKRTNISCPYYYRWIHGEIEFSKDICDRIEAYLNEVYAK